MSENKIQLFEDKRIRTAWNEEKEEWLFSVVDVVGVLTDSPDPNNYWKVLKTRLIKEGNQSVTNCNQLKLKSYKDGKHYNTDVANTEQLPRYSSAFRVSTMFSRRILREKSRFTSIESPKVNTKEMSSVA